MAKTSLNTTKNTQEAMLYSVIFDATAIKLAVAALLWALLVQPVSIVFAEGALPEADATIPEVTEPENEAVPESLTPEEPVDLVETTSETTSNPESDDSDPITSSSTTEVATTTPVGADPPDSGSASSTSTTSPDVDVGGDDIATSTDATVSTTTDSGPDTDLDVVATTTVATTSTSSVIVQPTIDDSNRHQFGSHECVSVGDGAFYCQQEVAEHTAEHIVSGVFAAPDSTGDREIYISVDGTSEVLTDNLFEDSAPYYDATNDTVVWHRLLNDRYQIVRYDLDLGIETVLTNSRVNNMEPVHEGDTTVWQRWYQNNWEIVYKTGDESITRITNSSAHDVAPAIQNGYILWQTTNSSGELQPMVYELASGAMTAINDNEGGQVKNPRFVLVYDTAFENGDVVTKGFDPQSGQVVPLAAQPVEVPTELPSSDPTDETRALIQHKTTSRSESETSEDFDDPIIPPTSSSTASTTDVVVATAQTSTTDTTLLETDDVIVPPFDVATTSATSTQVADR